ncbi:DUF6572 domain-containing protein [Jatrophihabitans telluris]|uniref:DUF6572 domain-containing protein n=1 Tax=Jatrophihabitans telluris TaxID=2038343 RepID=UPI003D3228C4
MAGIEDPGVVDLVTHDKQTGKYALIVVASQPCSDTDAQLTQLLQKINNYLLFALDESFLGAFPEAAGKPVRIQLNYATTPIEIGLAGHRIRASAAGRARHRFELARLGLDIPGTGAPGQTSGAVQRRGSSSHPDPPRTCPASLWSLPNERARPEHRG